MKTVVSVIGKDAVGITAKVSTVCSECNANILDITQSVLQDMFVMVMLTEIKDLNCTFSEFSDKMKELGKANGLDIRVMHEDIFNSMHRI
ncbi:MAG: ACT domain-containing protein [Clostridia bacterium]|nr:ACT domain-containing protein [Clostridia bacterium]